MAAPLARWAVDLVASNGDQFKTKSDPDRRGAFKNVGPEDHATRPCDCGRFPLSARYGRTESD